MFEKQTINQSEMKAVFKYFTLILVLSLSVFIIYALIPRVCKQKTDFGKALSVSNALSDPIKLEIKTFMQDSASRMQVLLALHKGAIVLQEGETDKLINCHSARKSIMSLLIGIAQDRGFLSIDESIASLGLDESKTPLRAQEKKATIRDLLMSSSGIFLQAEAEHDWQESYRPKRGQYKAGEYFFYNNFDFNLLGAILELKTGISIGKFMEEYLAKPLQMQEFSADNVVYNSPWPVPNKSQSDYPVFWIYMSARDFAKIGLLVIEDGKWADKEVISKAWLDESFNSLSNFTADDAKEYGPYEGFAFSWWLEGDTETIWADGYGGQFLCIDKTNNLVVVQRNFTGNSLLSSGLFLMDENRDNNPKRDLISIYKRIKAELID